MESLMRLLGDSDRMARVKARMPLLGLFVLSLYGWKIDFLAATWWVWGGAVLSILWVFKYRDWLTRICFGEEGGPFGNAMSYMLGAVLMWVIVVRTAGGAITLLFGHSAALRPVVMHIHRSRSHSGGILRGCQDQWRGDELDQLGETYICVKDAYEVLHPGYAPVYDGRQVEGELVGSRGPFGFYIRRLNVLRDIKADGNP